MKAIYVDTPGGIDQLKFADLPKPTAAAGQAVVKIHVAGVNFIDVYFRTGLYKADPPIVLGMEAAGIVDSIGEGVTGLKPGDRVAYALNRGAYAEYAAVPASTLVPIPPDIDDRSAAAIMLQGMTAHYLATSTFPLAPGHTCLIHAAAGGVGLLLVQVAKMRGARVIGTVGNAEKGKLARAAGADEIILYNDQDFKAEARRLTDGRGVDVVYDSVGASTFHQSIDSLRPRGMMVTFGNASGPVPAIEPLLLSQKGALFLTRPTLAPYVASREELLTRSSDLFTWVRSGSLNLRIDQTYPLANAAQAHADLESRRTSGKLLLTVLG